MLSQPSPPVRTGSVRKWTWQSKNGFLCVLPLTSFRSMVADTLSRARRNRGSISSAHNKNKTGLKKDKSNKKALKVIF